MTERDYFIQKLKALAWLKAFREQGHPRFTFRFARRTPSDLFQGEKNKSYFYVEVAERAGDKGRFYFNFQFILNEENSTIKQVKLQLRWADDNGETNPVYQQFARQVFPDIGDKKSKYKTFDGNIENEVRGSFVNWLERNYQTIVNSLENAILPENDFNDNLNSEVQILRDRGILTGDEVNGMYQLTDTAFQGANPVDVPVGPDNGEIPMQEEIKQLLESNLQVILTGAPGTGKTYMARKVAEELVCEGIEAEEERTNAKRNRIKSVQFHPGYDYSDFVIGMKPRLVGAEGNQQVTFEWCSGVFKKFVAAAKANPDHKYVFLIDEINRADLSRVFGEMFSLLEEDYRYYRDGDVERNATGILLPNGENFVIPKNLYIIGTMNDIDRSVESMDFALRRRFAWYEVSAEESEGIIDEKVHDQESAETLKRAMIALNLRIADPDFHLGSEYQLGGAIFAKYVKYIDDVNPFDMLWKRHIEIILKEYLRGRRTKGTDLNELKGIYDQSVRTPLPQEIPRPPVDPQPQV